MDMSIEGAVSNVLPTTCYVPALRSKEEGLVCQNTASETIYLSRSELHPKSTVMNLPYLPCDQFHSCAFPLFHVHLLHAP